MLSQPYTTLVFLWIVLGVVHTGFTSGAAERTASCLMGKYARYYRAICSLLILVTLLILVHYHFAAIDTILFRPHWMLKLLAAILVLPGFAVMVVYTWNYLVPFSGLGIVFGVESGNELQQTGLFGYTRHPMFAAAIIFMWGVFLGYPYMNNLLSAVCLTLYAFAAIYFAEKKLTGAYGNAYKQYQSRVPVLFPLRKR